ncbi:MAG: DEAD/DEAH box helicase [Candidatus Goldiibacteriota bacterium HGW-Goldbacteria-1]|jgi:ATP-dependent RNA helicase RhlE|nr:MAG: DEAD/DEAH box helicase [Candidatus Goldiibacteriota bacterium HGW-Goldbacteria-1]
MINENEGFTGLGIAPGILDILAKLKFTVPTPIQQKGIPIGVEGKDIIGIAQTGTGKTLAFGIPMVQRLAQAEGRGLIVVPTRELAIQVNETMIKLTPPFKMKTAVLIGGQSMYHQIQSLKAGPRIIIATPGRLLDHMQQKQIKLNDVRILVLDEADRMLDMGFMPQINRILKEVPKERQTMLFSATMPTDIVKIASTNMKLPVRTELAPQGTTAELVSQEIFVVRAELKLTILNEILKQYTGSVLLFTRTKRGATKVARGLKNAGVGAAEIHSDRSMGQRKDALDGFKSGRYRVLVATDIAARGIDVTGIELVINYDLPDDPSNYVHRIGRTGRAGRKGHAISLATPDQGSDVRGIEKIIRSVIPLSTHPTVNTEKFSASSSASNLVFSSSRMKNRGKKSKYR